MHVEVAVVGGGIAGVSAAASMAPHTSVLVLEAEPTLGYHSTGRSAALYTECYGEEPIRRLSLASKSYFLNGADPLSTSRGVLFAASPEDQAEIDRFYDTFAPLVPDLEVWTPNEISERVPILDPARTAGGVFEPGAMDLDVHTILMSFAAATRAHGGEIETNARVTGLSRSGPVWNIITDRLSLTAETVVNAAGAWGDHVAALAEVSPLSLAPLKRSAFTFDPGLPTGDWPMVVDMGENWYLKPEGPFLLGSAASELVEKPGDAKPDEIDVALGIMRINEATGLTIRSIKNQWAGQRTFTPDRVPAVGFDTTTNGFFWLVGQGGYGIHTSPGMGSLAAGLILDGEVPAHLQSHGITQQMFDPARFR